MQKKNKEEKASKWESQTDGKSLRTPPVDFLGKFYTDSLVHSQKSLDLLVDVIGEDKIILGTDYPFPLGELALW